MESCLLGLSSPVLPETVFGEGEYVADNDVDAGLDDCDFLGSGRGGNLKKLLVSEC